MAGDRFGMTLAEVEREHIIATVQGCGGNRTRAAKILHVSIRSLRMKIQQYRNGSYELVPADATYLNASDYPWDDPIL